MSTLQHISCLFDAIWLVLWACVCIKHMLAGNRWRALVAASFVLVFLHMIANP